MNLAFRTIEPKQLEFIERLRLAWSLLWNSRWKPTVRFSNGVELDFHSQRIILNHPTELLAKENLKITSRKHLILTSGRTQVPNAPEGYIYGIWENTDLDEDGQPILAEVNLKLFEPVAFGSTPIHL